MADRQQLYRVLRPRRPPYGGQDGPKGAVGDGLRAGAWGAAPVRPSPAALVRGGMGLGMDGSWVSAAPVRPSPAALPARRHGGARRVN